ncbi:MAG: hypothetical protein SFW35_13520 [Chitinophagales bacterium]|nr:hypothetical protein [Chitinophagales bacterium]
MKSIAISMAVLALGMASCNCNRDNSGTANEMGTADSINAVSTGTDGQTDGSNMGTGTHGSNSSTSQGTGTESTGNIERPGDTTNLPPTTYDADDKSYAPNSGGGIGHRSDTIKRDKSISGSARDKSNP